MASSFVEQIPTIIRLIQSLGPKRVLDIGKGFGKYGFLIHEYVGIDNLKRIDPSKTLAELSNLKIDAVEADKDLMLPHLNQIYTTTFAGDVTKIYKDLPSFELVLMIDVIEHLDKGSAVEVLKYFLELNTNILIATPINYFQQELYESDYEHHISHWKLKDFKALGIVESQYFGDGAVYLLSTRKLNLNNFGNSFYKKLKRIRRAILREI